MKHTLACITVVVWVMTLAACNAPKPSPTPPLLPTAQPTPVSTSTSAPTSAPDGAPTVTPLQTATLVGRPTATATATLTPTVAGRSEPVPVKPPAQGAPLEFTADDIEYAPSAPRTGDRKIQLTIRLKPKGGAPPFSFLLDSATQVNGLTYTFDWHNCGASEPHTILLMSADGQKSSSIGFMYPYPCE